MDDIEKSYIRRNEEDIAWERIEEEVFIILTREAKEKVFKLNKTAGYVWENADGTKTVKELVDKLCREYDVNASQALIDTKKFLIQMKNLQLFIVSQSSP
jgi:hypothetical protein